MNSTRKLQVTQTWGVAAVGPTTTSLSVELINSGTGSVYLAIDVAVPTITEGHVKKVGGGITLVDLSDGESLYSRVPSDVTAIATLIITGG